MLFTLHFPHSSWDHNVTWMGSRVPTQRHDISASLAVCRPRPPLSPIPTGSCLADVVGYLWSSPFFKKGVFTLSYSHSFARPCPSCHSALRGPGNSSTHGKQPKPVFCLSHFCLFWWYFCDMQLNKFPTETKWHRKFKQCI